MTIADATIERPCKPAAPAIGSIPMRLRERPQWVVWKYVLRENKWTKPLYNARTGALADSTDPSSWSSFEEALATYECDRTFDGVGYVFSPDDPYCGIDLDDSLDETGAPKPWAARFLRELNSYTEVSPSQTGVKSVVLGRKPGERCKKKYADGVVEMYDKERFFTMTGQHLAGTPLDIRPAQDGVDAVYGEVFAPSARTTVATVPALPEAPSLSDEQLLQKAKRSRKSGSKFQALWAGQWEAYFKSQSEADSSVVFTLAFYTKDAGQIDRMFRTSGLMREKWDDMHGAQTYGQMTIGNALAQVTNQYTPRPPEGQVSRPPRPTPVPPSNPSLPELIVDGVQLGDLTQQAIEAVQAANDPPVLFVRTGALARITRDEKHVPRIETLDKTRVRCHLTQAANFFTRRKGGDGWENVATNPPLALAENLLALGRWPLPPLTGLTRSPILRPDGSICTAPGFDATSGLYYAPDPGLVLTPIPDAPDHHEIAACADLLLGIIADFPFVDHASRANALSILFSVLMRPVIRGHIPLAIVDAPTQGTGKTLLITCLGTIAVGTVSVESIPADQKDDEWRKKITSILRSASPFILLDNIPDNTTITSPALAAALTCDEWSDRLLGRNDSLRVPSRSVWVATGNNLRVAGDMPRRSYSVRLDANAERPWERSGFKIRGLERHVAERRGDLLSAALTIIRAWYLAGRPQASVPVLGSFDEWAATVGSVLAFGGVEGFLANLDEMHSVKDEETLQWEAFFDCWWTQFEGKPVSAADLAQVIAQQADGGFALPCALLVQRDRGDGSLRRSLGRHLSRLVDRIYSGRKLLDGGEDTHRKVKLYRLEPATKGTTAGLITPLIPNNPAANPAQGGVL